MRPFGILVGTASRFREPRIPEGRLARAKVSVRNPLDEQLTEIFNHACLENDLQAAAELLAVLETWHARRPYHDDSERRNDAIHVKRMASELERRHIMRGTRPAAPPVRPAT